MKTNSKINIFFKKFNINFFFKTTINQNSYLKKFFMMNDNWYGKCSPLVFIILFPI